MVGVEFGEVREQVESVIGWGREGMGVIKQPSPRARRGRYRRPCKSHCNMGTTTSGPTICSWDCCVRVEALPPATSLILE